MIPELAAAAHTVEVTIEAIRDIANSTLPDAETDATDSSTGFRNLSLPVSAFGDSPLGQELGHQHQGAHEVFAATIEGTIADLQDFRQKLLDAMKNHETTDEAAQDLLRGISQRYDGHQYQSTHRFDETRTHLADDLNGGHAYDGGAQAEAGAPDTSAAAGTDAGTEPSTQPQGDTGETGSQPAFG